jgi:hypothetical protein
MAAILPYLGRLQTKLDLPVIEVRAGMFQFFGVPPVAQFSRSISPLRRLSHCPCNSDRQRLHSLQRAAVASNWRAQMNTSYVTRISGLLIAVLMTVAINGTMLLKFDAVAQEGVIANSGKTPTVVTLGTVNVGAHRS